MSYSCIHFFFFCFLDALPAPSNLHQYRNQAFLTCIKLPNHESSIQQADICLSECHYGNVSVLSDRWLYSNCTVNKQARYQQTRAENHRDRSAANAPPALDHPKCPRV